MEQKTYLKRHKRAVIAVLIIAAIVISLICLLMPRKLARENDEITVNAVEYMDESIIERVDLEKIEEVIRCAEVELIVDFRNPFQHEYLKWSISFFAGNDHWDMILGEDDTYMNIVYGHHISYRVKNYEELLAELEKCIP